MSMLSKKAFLAPAGTMRLNGAFTHFSCQFLNLHVDGQCLKNSHWFCLNFVCEMRIYLFGLYLRFKSQYKFLGIKLYKLPLNL